MLKQKLYTFVAIFSSVYNISLSVIFRSSMFVEISVRFLIFHLSVSSVIEHIFCTVFVATFHGSGDYRGLTSPIDVELYAPGASDFLKVGQASIATPCFVFFSHIRQAPFMNTISPSIIHLFWSNFLCKLLPNEKKCRTVTLLQETTSALRPLQDCREIRLLYGTATQ